MIKLSVKDFSCIDKAELELGQMTIIIGPQASGKSVLSKLTYFFYSILEDQYPFIEDNKNLEAFKDNIKEKFLEWFPSSAWGPKKFCICFSVGTFEVKFTRSGYRGKISDGFRVSLSDYFENHYESLASSYLATSKDRPDNDWEVFYKIMETSRSKLKKELGNDYIDNQLFIPAGRSFFTNMGKAVVAFEQTQMLDPITTRFGKFYVAYKDRHRRFLVNDRQTTKRTIAKFSEEILNGKIKLDRSKEFVETKDGRKIPFSALSSGQQELLPLLIVMEHYSGMSIAESMRKRLVYIEEPEAHLFPSAQCSLIKTLCELVVSNRNSLDMVITTHSPYVLSQLNNLLKASELAKSLGTKAQKEINQIIPKEFWLSREKFRAYAIINGKLISIINKDSLIDAEYLDSISSEIAREFSSLLELEISHEKN